MATISPSYDWLAKYEKRKELQASCGTETTGERSDAGRIAIGRVCPEIAASQESAVSDPSLNKIDAPCVRG